MGHAEENRRDFFFENRARQLFTRAAHSHSRRRGASITELVEMANISSSIVRAPGHLNGRILAASVPVCLETLRQRKQYVPVEGSTSWDAVVFINALNHGFEQYFNTLSPILDNVNFFHDMIYLSEQYGSRNSRTHTRSYVLINDAGHQSQMRRNHPLIFPNDHVFLMPATVLTYIRVGARNVDTLLQIVDFALLQFYAPHIDRLRWPFAEAAEIWTSEIDLNLYDDRRTLFAIPIDKLAGKFVPGIFDDDFKFEPIVKNQQWNTERLRYNTIPRYQAYARKAMAVLRLPETPVDADQDELPLQENPVEFQDNQDAD
jgi:hypothetical protein